MKKWKISLDSLHFISCFIVVLTWSHYFIHEEWCHFFSLWFLCLLKSNYSFQSEITKHYVHISWPKFQTWPSNFFFILNMICLQLWSPEFLYKSAHFFGYVCKWKISKFGWQHGCKNVILHLLHQGICAPVLM